MQPCLILRLLMVRQQHNYDQDDKTGSKIQNELLLPDPVPLNFIIGIQRSILRFISQIELGLQQ